MIQSKAEHQVLFRPIFDFLYGQPDISESIDCTERNLGLVNAPRDRAKRCKIRLHLFIDWNGQRHVGEKFENSGIHWNTCLLVVAV
jgi:hypothetical protein